MNKQQETLKLALEALEAHADIGIKSDKAITAIREALAEQPPYRAVKTWHDGKPVYVAEQPAQQQAYQQANPLGGPAKVFDAMADAIRAGDDYHAVLRQYGYIEAQQQEPVAWATQLNEYAHIQWGAKRPEYPMVYEFPLYTTPPHRKPLTDEGIYKIANDLFYGNGPCDTLAMCRAIEAAHGIKGDA